MARKSYSIEQAEQAFADALSGRGEVSHDELNDALKASGNDDAWMHLRNVKHGGKLKSRVVSTGTDQTPVLVYEWVG